MKRLAILGATGSIGRNTLAILEAFPERFCAVALTARGNVALLAEQVKRFRPRLAVVQDETAAHELSARLGRPMATEVLWGPEGYRAAASHPEAEMVVSALVGAAGLLPTLAAIEAGKDIALANKETLVMAGPLVMQRAAARGVRILPVDSEHSAIFQCLEGQPRQGVERLWLTASGGPFRDLPAAGFAAIRPADALRHPTWRMGAKISIDSATLMNKGLEVIEAQHLFAMPVERISVVVHPQSIVHSMVAFVDGALLAQMGPPDMKGAIAYALAYPERLPRPTAALDLAGIGALTFEEPDTDRFPCLGLAFEAGRRGGSLPAVMNAANEVAVQAFLAERLPFNGIPRVIDQTLQRHVPLARPGLEELQAADRWARGAAEVFVARGEA
jgi:1-deoxy-D-xylulose-5-phosphate reductoisomerase